MQAGLALRVLIGACLLVALSVGSGYALNAQTSQTDEAYTMLHLYTPDGQPPKTVNAPYVLQEYDTTPLDGRTPLVLIHGIAPDQGAYYNWGLFLTALQSNTGFNERFKIYFFVYEPQRELSETSAQLATALKSFAQENHPPQVRILALSLGGLLIKHAMADPAVDSLVDKVITIGTPFHGTPLAVPSWMRTQFKQESILSPLRLGNRLVFGIVRNKFPHFEKDFCWDNFDGAMSDAMQQRVSAKLHSESVSSRVVNSTKFITYSSFFNADVKEQARLMKALNMQRFRENVVSENLPIKSGKFKLIDKHRMMAIVSRNMAKLPLAYPQPGNAGLTSEYVGYAVPAIEPAKEEPSAIPLLMAFNDGVSPVASHLWLGRFCPDLQGADNVNAELWRALKQAQQSNHARLFADIDHRDWMEATTRSGVTNVRDLLHADQPPKTVFEWLVFDLMDI